MLTIESPAQILTPGEWRTKRTQDMAGGTIEKPTTLYLTNAGTTLGPALLIERWDSDLATREARMSRAQFRGDESHREGCASGTYRTWERDSCSTCALLGWGAHAEASNGNPGPNYAGWARTYIQAREPIPRAWMPAFLAEINDEENTSYRDALRRDVATWGYRLTDERPGYRLPTPTAEKMEAWLIDYHEGDDAFDLLEHVKEIVRDSDEYDTASRRAAFRLFNRLTNPTTA